MLKVERLQVRYGDFEAVSSVSLEVAEGRVVSLIGANGAGKSSLLSAMAGLIRPAAGTVTFQGEDITGMTCEQIVQRGLCLVPQGGRCFQRMSVEDNLLVGSYPRRARADRRSSLEMVYSLFPVLQEKRKQAAGTLSGGQRQMVAIARALMAKPTCLMFDEISLGLAPIVIQDLYDTIRRIHQEQGMSVIVVEQDTERALRVSDYSYVMLEGAVSLSGPSDTLTMEKIRSAYFGVERSEGQ